LPQGGKVPMTARSPAYAAKDGRIIHRNQSPQ
jgi:hypothetical protein